MKKLICTLLALAIMLCSLAMAEGREIRPMVSEIDLASPEDGIYHAVFEPDALADGALKFDIYTEDCYDIVDIDTMAVGDTFYFGGLDFEIESVARDEDGDVLINGGIDEGGFDLRAHDEDNCWKLALEDDYTTFTRYGETTLPLDDDVTFTDAWDIDNEPVIVNGAQAVADAIHGTEMTVFIYANTTVRVEGGKIVEIVREYMP